jgi:preprotein translocase subunit Sec61beta
VTINGDIMRRKGTNMPSSGAGLTRFSETERGTIQIPPAALIGIIVAIIAIQVTLLALN